MNGSDEERARREWRLRFRERVRLMERLLAHAPEDCIPTPDAVDEEASKP